MELPAELVGPVERGHPVGRIVFSADGRELQSRRPCLAASDYPQGNLWIRFRDGIILFFRGIFGKRPADA